MKTRQLGQSDTYTSALGLGCMGMTFNYGDAPDKNDMISLIHEAIDMGITMFDTAECYGPFANEELLGEALEGVRNKVLVATKFGYDCIRGQAHGAMNSRPEHIKCVCDEMLARLRTDHIDLLYQHRVDPAVPIEDVAGAVSDLIAAGKVRFFGLSEASPSTIMRAHKTCPVTALQTQYSFWAREPEAEILPTCERLGITFVAWSPLGQGFLTGKIPATATFAPNDCRSIFPRFTKEAMQANAKLLEVIGEVATQKNATSAQIALAWLLSRKPFVVPIPGTRKLERLKENIAATEISLTPQDIAYLDEGFNRCGVYGLREPAEYLARVDTSK